MPTCECGHEEDEHVHVGSGVKECTVCDCVLYEAAEEKGEP